MEPHSVASSVIIIQPGSTHLLIGRATDATPMVIPHAIAYRRLDGRPPPPHPSAALGAAESAALADATRVALDELPRVGLAGLGARALAAAPPDALVEWAWESPSAPVDGGPLPQYVCGRAAVGLAPSAPYELLYPLRRGRFNYAGTGGPGGLGGAAGTRAYSSTELTDALGRIWSHALADVLEIGAEERQSMGVLLLLRDGYERREAAEMLDVLAGLGFGALALHLRSACAALGAGLQSACIVECDEDTVEVSTVDDGVPCARHKFTLPFGGRDVDRYLHWLLTFESAEQAAPAGGGADANSGASAGRRLLAPASVRLDGFLPAPRTVLAAEAGPPASAPPADALPAAEGDDEGATWAVGVSALGRAESALTRPLHLGCARDAALLSWLRAARCGLRARTAAEQADASFELPAAPPPAVDGAPAAAGGAVRGRLGALASHAPALLLLDARIRNLLLAAERDATRAVEHAAWNGACANGERAPAAKRPCLAAFVGVDHSDYLHDAIASEIAADTRSHHAKPKGEAAGAPAAAPARRAFDENLLVALAAAAEPAVDELEIADAVVRAISAHGRVELRAKLYATVLLTGSCAGVAGLGPRLRDAIGRRLLAASDSPSAALPPTPVEVLVSTKAEPRHVAWRGATLVAASEPMHELWIQQGEWLNGGSRVLRERIPFSW